MVPERAVTVVVACVVLHDVACLHRDVMPVCGEVDDVDVNLHHHVNEDGAALRNHIAQTIFM